jgi:alkanesulfonate monooxygenase SsuD/methylene tetrahydromethanopterin reductase-like flavin-dependent oxidoreductase (luciferase family)
VALSAIASATDTLRLGPMVTPLARRRVQKLARETVTLDHLSSGRLTLGVGLGNADDLEPFGEAVDPRERGRLLDEGLDRLGGFWNGGFRPLPLQRPRIRAGSDAPFDLVVEVPPGADVRPWEAAGATWVLTSMDPQPAEPEVRAVVDAGP